MERQSSLDLIEIQKFRDAYALIPRDYCETCFNTGFRKVDGGVVKCECRDKDDAERERIALMLQDLKSTLADREYERLCGG